MKTQNQSSLKAMFKLALLALIVMIFSCSPETVLEPKENLSLENSKSEEANNTITYDLETFIQGSPISGANGIDIGPEGNLYIASVNGQEIVVMKENDGEIIDRIGPERGVLSPDDLVFGPDGTLYWTDILTGFVGRMTPDGGTNLLPLVSIPLPSHPMGASLWHWIFWAMGCMSLIPILLNLQGLWW